MCTPFVARLQLRTRAGLLVDSGEPREVHQFCLLVGYGADAVCPYLAFESLAMMQRDGKLPASLSLDELKKRFVKGVGVGVLKVRCFASSHNKFFALQDCLEYAGAAGTMSSRSRKACFSLLRRTFAQRCII